MKWWGMLLTFASFGQRLIEGVEQITEEDVENKKNIHSKLET